MNDNRYTWPWHWRRFTVDVLVGTSTIAVALAAVGSASDVRYILLIAAASMLVALGLVVEPNVTVQGPPLPEPDEPESEDWNVRSAEVRHSS